MHKIFLFLVVLMVVITSCGSEESVPDISNINTDVEVVRFDKLMHRVQDSSNVAELKRLKDKHPAFFNLFFKYILPLRGSTSDSLTYYLAKFNQDNRIGQLYHSIDSIYQDFTPVERKIEQALSYYAYYFQDTTSRKIYTFLSEYSFQNFIFPDEGGDGIGIGLDMFLGRDYPYKRLDPRNPAFSDYLTRTFSKEYISKKVMESIIMDKLGSPKGNKMIDHMIHNGKKLFILKKVLPTTPDSVIMEYSRKQMEWVEASELEMYSFFLDKELFYENNSIKINKYISPSPTSPGMPDIAPGRTANYIGWQIIKQYMEKHPDTTYDQLVKMDNAQKIMDRSGYKPKRKK